MTLFHLSKSESAYLLCTIMILGIVFSYDLSLFLAIIIMLTFSEASIMFLDYCAYVGQQYMAYAKLYLEQAK